RPFPTDALRRDGTVLPVEILDREMPIEGRALRVVLVTDLTDRRRAEEERNRASEHLDEVRRLAEVAQFKSQFLNTAAHELNTPLTPIRLQIELLRRRLHGSVSDADRRSLVILERNVERLIELVRDLLDAARLQSGRILLERRAVDVNRLVLETVESFQEPARQGGVAIGASVSPGLVVDGDPKRLTQVLFNLVSNALKFTPKGGEVRVSTSRRGDRIAIHVHDTGAGFTREQGVRLFQPFSQVHDTMQWTRAGTGLGLYISKGIVEAHGGEIRAASEGPEHGSTFTVEVPAAAPADAPVAESPDARRAGSPPPSSPS
ncbi:MAG: sensor histidine kinase, partial [Methanobacteriota archaeon]